MTNRKQALQELLAKVEAGEWTGDYSDIRDAQLRSGCYGLNRAGLVWDAYNGSLDAALALHNAVLPDYEYGYDGSIAWVKMPGLRSSYRCDAQNGLTARAWLIAILKALIAGEAE